MRILLFFVFFLIINCSNNKMVYWCGDHPCINKKEKEEYFKKTMTVEVRNLGNENFEDNSKNEKLINNVKKEQKTRIKKEKDIAKQLKLDQKKRIKEELAPEVTHEELYSLTKEDFQNIEELSIDYAIMEKQSSGKIVPYDGYWLDVGSFKALF